MAKYTSFFFFLFLIFINFIQNAKDFILNEIMKVTNNKKYINELYKNHLRKKQ